MSETTTWEIASRCPKCNEQGIDTGRTKQLRDRSQVRTLRCDNERCSWYDTTWIVQVNEDNTVPIRQAHEKEFPNVSPLDYKRAQEAIRRINDSEA